MTEHTPTPWDWLIHDHSMASLGVMPDPGLGNPLVLTISPCQACADRAEPREWKWGRCHTPSEADANFILTAVNNHDALVKALENIAARVPKKNPAWLRITCPICNYKSVEPHTEARHAPNCAGEVARAALGAMSCIPGAVSGSGERGK